MHPPIRASLSVRIAHVLLNILVPIISVLTSVGLLLTPPYVRLEYRMPGFPEDPYGFTLEDRLVWAPLARDYLLNNKGIEFLGDLRFDDGTPVFNERELRHMDDVKRLVQIALVVWVAGLGLIAVCCLALRRYGGREVLWKALRSAALATLFLMGALVAALVVGFSFVFVGFHRIFFEGDTWLFQYSDTLIRLFPQRFWQDVFFFVSLGTVLQALILQTLARRSLSKRI